jgi:hypothetical protein
VGIFISILFWFFLVCFDFGRSEGGTIQGQHLAGSAEGFAEA